MKAIALLLACLAVPAFAADAPRVLTIDDFARFREVSDPQLSPDGKLVLFAQRQPDLEADKNHSHVWMTSTDGSQTSQVTFGDDSESSARWSPDGRYISFLGARGGDDAKTQLWLLDRQGGEAQKITDFKGSVVSYEWSPDAKRFALIVEDPDPAAADKDDPKKKKTTPPIVVNRFQFKTDENGYLTTSRQHLYLLDLATRKSEILTPGLFNESNASFSPDGARIAFVTRRGDDPDRSDNDDIYVIDAKSGATPRQLTTWRGADGGDNGGPRWSPDGKWIAYVQGGAPELIYYAVRHLAVIAANGGEAKVLTSTFDRNVALPTWSSNGKSIYFLAEDDCTRVLDRIAATGGTIETIRGGKRAINDYDLRDNRIVSLEATTQRPADIIAFDTTSKNSERRLTHHNDDLLASLRLGATEEIDFPSKDGTRIHGFVIKPADYVAGHKYPTLLRIHGGPVSQYAHQFSFEPQLFAANGYAVILVNPRGSSGRGESFSKAIWADWGNLDTQDVLAAVDHVISLGIADPARLGVGGWSYGGILTNYVIATDKRFKAATSGASIANVLAGYGTDEYIREYELELGKPWEHTDVWMHISYPFLHADRISTPAMFLAGDKDFNVPLLNSEQMYQALRSLNVPTELIIYPGQHHGISKPSYVRDRYERYLAWYAKYVLGSGSSK
jgi:dipeptidyl aminopeptidase/acylaminoacyl peptidase